MDAGTVATIVTTVTTFLGLIAYIRAEIRDVRSDIRRLDDRVFALASGGKPFAPQNERGE